MFTILWIDVSDVYRKSANTKMIHPHIKGYFQDPKGNYPGLCSFVWNVPCTESFHLGVCVCVWCTNSVKARERTSFIIDFSAQEGFFQDEGLTKIYFAAFIKHYIK